MHARQPIAATFVFFHFFFGEVGQTAFAKSAITQHLIIVHTSFWSCSTHIDQLFLTMCHTRPIECAMRYYVLEPSFFGVHTVFKILVPIKKHVKDESYTQNVKNPRNPSKSLLALFCKLCRTWQSCWKSLRYLQNFEKGLPEWLYVYAASFAILYHKPHCQE